MSMRKVCGYLIFGLFLVLFLVFGYLFRQHIICICSDVYITLTDSVVEIERVRDNASLFYNNSSSDSQEAYIAHGGGIKQYVYTNSEEAIEDSINRGFKYIEIDFQLSSDNKLIGVHDWHSFEIRTSYSKGEAKKLTLEQLKA